MAKDQMSTHKVVKWAMGSTLVHYYKTKIEEELIMNVGVAESVSSSIGNLSSMYSNMWFFLKKRMKGIFI